MSVRLVWAPFAPLALALVALVACGARDVPPHASHLVGQAGFSCPPLSMEAERIRIATDSAARLHVRGGSGMATFALEGETRGSSIEPGGGIRAGVHAATFDAVARDGLCRSEARVKVEIVGPFDVQPARITVARGAKLTFAASGAIGDVRYKMLDRPTSAGREGFAKLDGATFDAGDTLGTYNLAARDVGSGNEARLAVTVGKPEPLRPRAMFAVPAGGRVRLDFAGGSSRVVAESVSGPAGGRTFEEDGALWFDASSARPGTAEVSVKDRFTGEPAKARVVVGETLGAPPFIRGSQSHLGDLASGDVNGDSKPDLVVGHAERSYAGFETGGILVHAGTDGGGFTEPAVIEGERASDHMGSVLAVLDLNGDGIDDVVAGTPEADLGGVDRGAVSLYLGSPAGLEPEPDRVLAGEAPNHRFGSAMAFADLDGDGARDVVVSAPLARNPADPRCEGGRIYVYRNGKARRGALETAPRQTIDVRAVFSASDASLGPTSAAKGGAPACASGPLGAGRALAILDMDGDKLPDLAVGVPLASFGPPFKNHGEVLVYRGLPGGAFATDPSWAIALDPSVRSDGALFGMGLDVVRAADASSSRAADTLVIRAPGFTPKAPAGASAAGGFWVFSSGALGPPTPSGSLRIPLVTSAAAHAFYMDGQRGRNVGQSAAIADVDPQPGVEYAVSGSGDAPRVIVFTAAQIVNGKGRLTPMAEMPQAANELAGFRLSGIGVPGGTGSSLASWSPWRTTKQGPFVGAIDVIAAGASPLASRWGNKKSIELRDFATHDRAGQNVAFVSERANVAPLAVVGTPGAQSAARASGGAVDLFAVDGARPIQRLTGDRKDAQLGAGPVVSLDFDGDGKLDLAVGDPLEYAGIPANGFTDPGGCSALDAKGNPLTVAGRGVVRIYSKVDGAMVERFRLTAPRESKRDVTGMPSYTRSRFGFSIAAADVNGDGKDDIISGRPGSTETSGAEVVLGRNPDREGKVLIACNSGERGKDGALVMASGNTAENPASYGFAVARIGDLDKDGCDEIAMSMTFSEIPARAGIAIAFGYDATRAHCRGHDRPFVLRLAPDDHPLDDNIAGDPKTYRNDFLDFPRPSAMGRVLSRGGGDFTGDGVPDLVFRDGELPFAGTRGSAVEIVSGAFLAGLCPNRICPKGRRGPLYSDGDWHVVAMRPLAAPIRRIVPVGGPARGAIASMMLEDLNADGMADLAIGVTDDSDQGAFAGEVRVFLGGATTSSQEALLGDPFLIAVGDVGERSGFGTSVALESGALLVGAPMSTRRRTGPSVGAAYRWSLPQSETRTGTAGRGARR